jgi:hypothetical protein
VILRKDRCEVICFSQFVDDCFHVGIQGWIVHEYGGGCNERREGPCFHLYSNMDLRCFMLDCQCLNGKAKFSLLNFAHPLFC